MAILSTLRSLTFRLWSLISGSLPVTTESSESLSALNDDCLLLLLKHFSLPQLFHIRAISPRLCFLIQRDRFSKCRTLVYGNGKSNEMTQTSVEVFFTNDQHVYSDYCKQIQLVMKDRISIPTLQQQPVLVRLHTMPLSLPFLLPHLTCLTWTHFFADQVQLPTDEQIVVNRLLVAYLRSSWSTSLVSLHLYLNVPSKPQANYAYFFQLGQLTQLKHLFLEFTQFVTQEVSFLALIPDSMPILSQLVSFSLHFYGSSNTAKLLTQLGPNLAFLSLFEVACSVKDYASFLRANPTYGRTLKRIEVVLHKTLDYQVFAVTAECLSSLERFFAFFKSPEVDLLLFFTALSRLQNLREFLYVPLYVDQLRSLRMRYPQSGFLPRLSFINNASIYIINVNPSETFQPAELFDNLLPFLSAVFCALEQLRICFIQSPPNIFICQPNKTLGEQLSNRAMELFPKLRHCTALYYSITQQGS